MHKIEIKFIQNQKIDIQKRIKTYTFPEVILKIYIQNKISEYNNFMPFKSFFKYLSISTKDEAWPLFCTSTGAISVEPGQPYPYNAENHPKEYVSNWKNGRKLNEYQILYITKGTGTFKTMDTEYIIKPGTIFVLFPNVPHWYLPSPEKGWIEHWVGFNGEIPALLQNRGFFTPANPIFYIGYDQNIIDLYNVIIEYAKEEKYGYQQMISSKILEIMTRVYVSANDDHENEKTKQFVDKVKFILTESLYSVLDIKSVAAQLSISYKTMREIFKNYTGLTPYQYFLHLKINKAKELLTEEKYSVKEISYKLEFQNPYYFSRLFKKKTGVSPSQWNSNFNIKDDLVDYKE